ncbi:unnamed protein product, partial [Ectocarpus sp. 12 AP-2014]
LTSRCRTAAVIVITPGVTAGPQRTTGRSTGQPAGSQDLMSRVANEQHGAGRSPFDGREPRVGTFRGEASLAQVHLQDAPLAWTYERRPSVKLAKSQ